MTWAICLPPSWPKRGGAANASAERVLETLETSRVNLAIVLLSSLVVILGAIFYVNRSLGSRLSAFSNAALSLAGGNLHVALPEASGRDEVSRLMRALAVFRDTAVEMERTNLREIAETRQRLIDAIESIPDGFAFFDESDHLVLCNARYRGFSGRSEGTFRAAGNIHCPTGRAGPGRDRRPRRRQSCPGPAGGENRGCFR